MLTLALRPLTNAPMYIDACRTRYHPWHPFPSLDLLQGRRAAREEQSYSVTPNGERWPLPIDRVIRKDSGPCGHPGRPLIMRRLDVIINPLLSTRIVDIWTTEPIERALLLLVVATVYPSSFGGE